MLNEVLHPICPAPENVVLHPLSTAPENDVLPPLSTAPENDVLPPLSTASEKEALHPLSIAAENDVLQPLSTAAENDVLHPLSTAPENEDSAVKVDQDDLDFSLDVLEPLNQLFIKQKSKVNYIPFIRRRRNKYSVETPDNTLLFTIVEDNSWWGTFFWYRLRPCQLRVYDRDSVEVMRINRPFACTPRVFPCQLQHLAVFSPPRQLIGTIEQQWSAMRPLYKARDENGTDIFFLRGPILTMSNILEDVEFPVQHRSGASAAMLCKKSKGIEAVLFPKCPKEYCITFTSPSIAVKHKALLVALTLLLDYMYYD